MKKTVLYIMTALTGCVVSTSYAATPCTPDATPAAKALYQYLGDISGKNILSGQESMLSEGAAPSNRDKYVFQRVNKYPAIYTTDFGDVGKSNLADRKKVVTNCTKAHDSGSIIAIQYHMIQPDLEDGSGFSAMNIKGSTYTKFNEILTEGSTLNVEFKKRLDEIAGYFKTMESKGIAVLWRPYHEMNGDFFWWSYQDKFKDMWKYTWKYMVETKKCNNLLWVFGVNHYGAAAATSKQSPAFYYPGHEYVDVLSVDIYTEYGHSYEKRIHDELRTLGNNKPIAIAENGTMPDIPAIKADQPYWAYWCTWWGFEGSDKGNTDALYTKNYGDPTVLTRDEIPPAVLHPSTSVQRVLSECAIPGATLQCTRSSSGITVTSASPCDRIVVYSISGKQVAAFSAVRGFLPFATIGTGTYIIQGIRGTEASMVRFTVQR